MRIETSDDPRREDTEKQGGEGSKYTNVCIRMALSWRNNRRSVQHRVGDKTPSFEMTLTLLPRKSWPKRCLPSLQTLYQFLCQDGKQDQTDIWKGSGASVTHGTSTLDVSGHAYLGTNRSSPELNCFVTIWYVDIFRSLSAYCASRTEVFHE